MERNISNNYEVANQPDQDLHQDQEPLTQIERQEPTFANSISGFRLRKALPIMSVSDAEDRMEGWVLSDEFDADLPEFILRSLSDKEQRIYGSADNYHNLASEFARKDLYLHAAKVASLGVGRYGCNSDLLADMIKYCANIQDWENCEEAYSRLKEIDYKRWNWRAYTFVIDYLLDKMETEITNRDSWIEKDIRTHIENYKKLKDERAWVAESEYYIKLGERGKAIKALKDGLKSVVVTPQICVKLADMLLEEGKYSEVVKIAAIGIRSTAQDQPTANLGYLVYVSALAKDALLHNEEMDNEGVFGKGYKNTALVESALLDYHIAEELLASTIYKGNISRRKLVLREKSGISEETPQIENDEIRKELLRKLVEFETEDVC